MTTPRAAMAITEDVNFRLFLVARHIATVVGQSGPAPTPYESRTIPMPCWVVDSLIELQEISENGCPYLFLSKDCFERVSKKWKKMVKEDRADHWQNRMMKSNALFQFKHYCRKAGLNTNKKLNLHCLRKGYGMNLMKLGTPANTLKELMGHSSIVTTMKFYINSIDENKKKAVEGLDRLMG